MARAFMAQCDKFVGKGVSMNSLHEQHTHLSLAPPVFILVCLYLTLHLPALNKLCVCKVIVLLLQARAASIVLLGSAVPFDSTKVGAQNKWTCKSSTHRLLFLKRNRQGNEACTKVIRQTCFPTPRRMPASMPALTGSTIPALGQQGVIHTVSSSGLHSSRELLL
eukprot:1154194-Pelagomonas_calceolata.AAC.3